MVIEMSTFRLGMVKYGKFIRVTMDKIDENGNSYVDEIPIRNHS